MVDEVTKGDVNNRREVFGRKETSGELVIFRFDDATLRLLVDSLTESVGHGSIKNGGVSVGTSITRLITASTPCKRVIVHAAGGHIVIGGSDVIYTEATRKGVWLPKHNSMVFYVSNVNLLYARAASASTNVTFTYEN